MTQKELAAREGEMTTYGITDLFEDLLGGLPSLRFSTAPRAWAPRCDIKETDKEYIVTAALPGVKKEDVHISVENGMLTLSGERKEDKEEKGKGYLRREMMSGSFMRSFTLPVGLHPEDIKAKHVDGVLTVHIRKPHEVKQRGVDVKID